MVAFFKVDIATLMSDDTRLSEGAFRAYMVIQAFIYMKEGRVVLTEQAAAGLCRQTVRAFKKNLDELLAAGKLTRDAEGCLVCERAEQELEQIRENRKNAAIGGKRSSKSADSSSKRAKISENPGQSRPGSENPSPKVSRIEEIDTAKALKTNDGAEATLVRAAEHKRVELEEEEEEGEKKAAAAQQPRARAAEPTSGSRDRDHDWLEARLRAAVERENSPELVLSDVSAIVALLDAGYDLEREVLPVIRGKARQARSARSWKWFVPAIEEARANRPKTLAAPVEVIKRLEGEELRRGQFSAALAHWRDIRDGRGSHWMPQWPNRPGTPGCTISEDVIEEARQVVEREAEEALKQRANGHDPSPLPAIK